MKKYIFSLGAALLCIFLFAFINAFIIKDGGRAVILIGGALSYFVGRFVYKRFKKIEQEEKSGVDIENTNGQDKPVNE